jgi:hypothetical protein
MISVIVPVVDFCPRSGGGLYLTTIPASAKPTTIITLANHSLSATRLRTSTAPRVINMPNHHRRAPPNDGQKISPPTRPRHAAVRAVTFET